GSLESGQAVGRRRSPVSLSLNGTRFLTLFELSFKQDRTHVQHPYLNPGGRPRLASGPHGPGSRGVSRMTLSFIHTPAGLVPGDPRRNASSSPCGTVGGTRAKRNELSSGARSMRSWGSERHRRDTVECECAYDLRVSGSRC